MTAFKQAELYEILGNKGGRLEREGSFLLEALAAAPSKAVADLACGLGLHALWLAERGAEVYAFDLSPEMILYAKAHRYHPAIVYGVGDMSVPTGGPYGLVLCLGNSLSLLDSTDRLEQFYAGVYAVLMPGGRLITQTLNYSAPQMNSDRIRVERATLPDGELAAIKRFHPQQGRTNLDITYLAVDSTGFSESKGAFSLQHWEASLLTENAQIAGFTIDGLFGGYDRTAFSGDSTDIVMMSSKPAV